MTIGNTTYTRLEQHEMTEAGCRITNRAFKTTLGGDNMGEEVPLSEVDQWADLSPEATIEGVDRPLFAILRMPFANTIDPESPLGVSAYARATGLIREADRQFSRMLWEMESGQRALYVGIDAFMADTADPGMIPFKRFYRFMDNPVEQGEGLYHEWSPDLREQNQINALNEILQKIEDACGLSRGTLSDAPESSAGGARTATELKIMRQRTYATIVDTQKSVKQALEQLLWAMDVWATIGELAPAGLYDVSFEFDDSIVSDRAIEFTERMQLVTARILNPWEMRKWYTGETEKEAKRNLPGGIVRGVDDEQPEGNNADDFV